MLLYSSSCCCFTPFFFLIVLLISNSLFSFLVLFCTCCSILYIFILFGTFAPAQSIFQFLCCFFPHLLSSFSPVFAASFKCNICILLWNAKQYHSSNNFIQTFFSLWLPFLVDSVQIIHRFCSILFKCHKDRTRNSRVILRFQKANLKGIKCFTRK